MTLDHLSVAQWHAAISKALQAHDVQAAAGLIAVMAIYHPRDAEYLRSLILLLKERDSA